MTLSATDRELIEILKNVGVLEQVQANRFDQRNGVIAVICADGDQSADLLDFQAATQKNQRDTPRIHTFGINGGALRICPQSGTNQPGRTTDVDLLDDIRAARDMKGIDNLALFTHAPCGQAAAVELTLLEALKALADARARVEREISKIRAACFVHIDYDGKRKRTYHLDTPKLEQFVSR